MHLLQEIIFVFFALLTLGSAIYMAVTSNVIYAAFSLLLTFIGVAALYIFASAEFLGLTQIMIYVGGILILIVFGVMLTNKIGDTAVNAKSINVVTGLLLSSALFTLLMNAIMEINFAKLSWIKNGLLVNGNTTSGIGINLMTQYILPFELIAVLLLVALMGASLIAGRKTNP
jgi:NADH-quinone oxidoreductase subunit J